VSDVVHALSEALQAAADGRFPAVDGLAEVHRPDDSGTHAVVEFTGHAFVLTTHPSTEVVDRGANGFGGAGQPDLLRWLAGPGGAIGSHDAVLVARGTGGRAVNGLAARDDLDTHPRVVRARRHRRNVRVFGDERGLVTLGHGLVGRFEISVELLGTATASSGAGRELIAAGLDRAPANAVVWAQVAPGNAASLRAFLGAGFTPVAAEVLIHPRRMP
jgi:hypothetical protein